MTAVTAARPPVERRRGPGAAVTRDRVETRVFGVLRWVVIVFLLLITLFPFYYMVLLSFRPLERSCRTRALLWPASARSTSATYREVLSVAPTTAGRAS